MEKTVRVGVLPAVYRIRHIQIYVTRALIYSFSGSDRESINLVYEGLGPTPRLCLDYFKDPDHRRQYESDVGLEISKLTCKSLAKQCSWNGQALSQNLSHQVRYSVASLPIVEPITPYVRSKLVCQFRTLERREQVRL